jgi:predicted nuclease with TOPRIM domain
VTHGRPTDDLGWVSLPTQEFEYLTSENSRLVGRLKDVTLDNHALSQQIEQMGIERRWLVEEMKRLRDKLEHARTMLAACRSQSGSDDPTRPSSRS